MIDPNEADWRLQSPLTAHVVEQRLAVPAAPVRIIASRTVRSAPAADARLLSFLDRQRALNMPVDVRLDYLLSRLPEAANGWQQIREIVTLHLVSHYASTISDYDDQDVADRVRLAQRLHIGTHGIVTRVGGQAAVMDKNAVLGSGQSQTLFAATSTDQVELSLIELVASRGPAAASPVTPRLVTYLAEALENVREHATTGQDGSRAGICLLQLKNVNDNQLPRIEAQLPSGSSFRAYLTGIRARYGRRLHGVMELTVADSGRGIAGTLLGAPVESASPDDELQALLSAFRPGVTSKLTGGKGLGLSNMIQDIHAERGALQVRSGRFSLFRTSVSTDGRLVSSDPDTNDFWSVGELADAPGTAVTLIVPVVAGPR